MIISTPKELIEAKFKCIERTNECVDFLSFECGIKIPYPKIEFALKNGTGGQALLGGNIIQLNTTLLRENPDEYFDVVIPHEVCHLGAFKGWPKGKPHGREWASLMRVFGLPPAVCHNMDTSMVPSNFGRKKNPNAVVNTKVKYIGIGKVINFN